MKKSLNLSGLLIVMVLVACSGQTQQANLNGTEWTLEQLNGHSLVAGSHVEIRFDETGLSGFGGCNAYGGYYQTKGESFSIDEGVEATAMACLTPEGIGAQETEYFFALSAAEKYFISGESLEFQDGSGQTILIFRQKPAPQAFDFQSVAGSRWQVLTVNGEGLIPGSQITMEFSSPGQVLGFGGCRGYEADYLETDQGIRFTSVGMNEEPCNDQDLLIQEQDFTDYFTWADHFEVVDGDLVLHTQRGEEIVFAPLED